MADSEVIVSTIKNVSKLIETGDKESLLSLAIRGASQAKLLANFSKGYQTGQTKNSIQVLTGYGFRSGLNDSGGKPAEKEIDVPLRKNEAAVGATTAHAIYPEFGTRKQAPEPYLRPSLALVAGEAEAVIAAKMKYEFAKGPLKYGQSRVKF